MRRPSAEESAAIDAHIARHGVKKMPPAGTSTMTAEDRAAIASHAEEQQRRQAERVASKQHLHVGATPQQRRESAERARQAVAAGTGIVVKKEKPPPSPKLRRSPEPRQPNGGQSASRPGYNPVKTPINPGKSATSSGAAAPKRDHVVPPGTKPAMQPGFDPGPRPEMTWIDLSLLDVDHSYQRALSSRHAKKLAADFKWIAFQPITVARTAGGRYAVIDGQHRLQAAKSIPQVKDLPCYVVPSANVQQQASTFLDINNTHKLVTGIEKFRAGLLAEDADTVAIKRLLDAAGVALVGGNAGPMQTRCVSRLYALYRSHGAAILRRSLKAIGTAWPHDPDAFGEQYINALCVVFRYAPATDDERVHAALAVIRPRYFLAEQLAKGKETNQKGTSLVTAELYRRITGKEFKR